MNLYQAGKLPEALEILLALEKQMRLVSSSTTCSTADPCPDNVSTCSQAASLQETKELCVAIVRLCFETGSWTALNENIILLAKRRAQLKQVSLPPEKMS